MAPSNERLVVVDQWWNVVRIARRDPSIPEDDQKVDVLRDAADDMDEGCLHKRPYWS